MAKFTINQTKAGITHSLLTGSKLSIKSDDNRSGGRPSSYRKEYADQARKLCLLLSAEDKHLAVIFDVSERTVNRWKKAHPEFCQSIREGKLIADMNVAASLYNRAVGMFIKKTHFSSYLNEVTAVDHYEELPPDVKACIFWLKNRQKNIWRDVIARKADEGGAFSIIIHKELHPDDQKRLDMENSK
ncbi:MAG: helix-turn-helix domain-containing protein [Proteobacteria bacterium]|nr:helix-turn-helix domain-containing protein [Pseudomonadota bacterium]